MARLRRSVATDSVDLGVVKALARTKVLLVSYGVRVGIAVGTLFLMTTKPDLVASVAILIASAVVGAVVALVPRRTMACSVPQHLAEGIK